MEEELASIQPSLDLLSRYAPDILTKLDTESEALGSSVKPLLESKKGAPAGSAKSTVLADNQVVIATTLAALRTVTREAVESLQIVQTKLGDLDTAMQRAETTRRGLEILAMLSGVAAGILKGQSSQGLAFLAGISAAATALPRVFRSKKAGENWPAHQAKIVEALADGERVQRDLAMLDPAETRAKLNPVIRKGNNLIKMLTKENLLLGVAGTTQRTITAEAE